MSGALDGRTAVVTGAFGRLGPIWCKALLDAGASVVGIDLPGAAPSSQYSDLQRRAGNSLLTMVGDVLGRDSLVTARSCAGRGERLRRCWSTTRASTSLQAPPRPTESKKFRSSRFGVRSRST